MAPRLGGSTNLGTIFELQPPTSSGSPWTQTVIYKFTGGTYGAGPRGAVLGSGNVLYGVANTGSSSNLGTAFSLTL